jgi:hypothetical protein
MDGRISAAVAAAASAADGALRRALARVRSAPPAQLAAAGAAGAVLLGAGA